jgi:hypothetical protein
MRGSDFLAGGSDGPGHAGDQPLCPVLGCNAVLAGILCVSSGWITQGRPISPDSDRDPVRILIVIRQPPRRNSSANGQALLPTWIQSEYGEPRLGAIIHPVAMRSSTARYGHDELLSRRVFEEWLSW